MIFSELLKQPNLTASDIAAGDNAPNQKATLTLPCVHCGEPTECGADSIPDRVFCCSGCIGAYQLIRGLGLQDFYALRDQAKSTGVANQAGQCSRYDQFDSEEYLGPSAPQSRPDGSMCTTLAVQGLHCAACAWLIENAATREPGLLSTRVKMSEHTIQLIYDPAVTKLSKIARLLDRLGYQLLPFDPSHNDHLLQEGRRLLTQIAIAGFFAANAMWIAIALYAGASTSLAANYGYFLGLVGTSLGVMAVSGPGRTFFVGALASIRTRTPHMDLPVALGLLVGTLVGTFNAITGYGHVYFDSMATLVFLLLIGRWIQFRQQQHAAKAVDLLMRVTPRHARLVGENGVGRQVLADTLVAGDVIEVLTGESVPADGLVIGDPLSGSGTSLDCSLLTGESIPVRVNLGDAVSAGVVNLGTPICVRVKAVGLESRIGKVMQSVELATTEKTPIVMLADRIGGYFVIAVMCLAIMTFLLWLGSGLGIATSNATALLIVACPCALALATPLAIAVGLGRAAGRGILIRDGNTLQQLAKPGRIWFDKTGTLTEGRQMVSSLVGSNEGLAFGAALERHCKHPVAEAVIREARARRLVVSEDSVLTKSCLGGVLGRVDGTPVAVGNIEFARAQGFGIPTKLISLAGKLIGEGQSPIVIAVDGIVVSLLGLADPIRDGASELVGGLRQKGWKVGMLSGDHAAIVQRVASKLKLQSGECFGGLAPEEKLSTIRKSRHTDETVVMIGDGANDAAALASADVGIAVRGGAEVSLQAAPVFISTGNLQTLSELFDGSKRTHRLIWMTFAVSLAYNVIAVGLAIAGLISPLVAAILMPLSSVTVLAITLGQQTFRETRRQ